MSWTVPANQSTGWLAFDTDEWHTANWTRATHHANWTTTKRDGTAVHPVTGHNLGFTYS